MTVNENKRLANILIGIPLLLLIPLIAMQFTPEVNWTLSDFIVMGGLLLAVGLLVELVLRKVSTRRNRILLGLAILFGFLLVWAELAVGVFGTIFAGT